MYPEDLLLLAGFTTNLLGMAFLALIASKKSRAQANIKVLKEEVDRGMLILVFTAIAFMFAFTLLRLLALAEQNL
ncbi:hypothetical protein Pyrde_0626 [Pyrodictium delaneyi]|uniref:Uncharacterized protein n=1 Tax=Pyrodictium delaneyi TaxID=1273541 RepID=A0A0P0N373_9CREN|nr:hypothetical protein [Pyrodictium delaneyi]ALL00676.1 hypothetical protein Pyrde_0626 [Pyrodictium delaneyi]OWJ54122.1 hypothetical protein Pdsh_09735 [Pyrodictium delaneyi]